MIEIESKQIRLATAHQLQPLWRHIYAVPYCAIFYPLVFQARSMIETKEYYYILVGVMLAVQVLLFLSCQWSTEINVLFCYSKSPVQEAQYICLRSNKKQMKSELVPVAKGRFEYQRKNFVWNGDKKRFDKLRYPVVNDISHYIQSQGFKKEEELKDSKEFGKNEFNIPIPTFIELFKEHAVAPFFVFQMFCVCLWFLDEYWYYSLFTLFMLVIFESTVVFQRLRNLKELRSMSQAPSEVQVRRLGKWSLCKSTDLLPGDCISVVRPANEETALPCDVLLTSGKVIVNEALLTGESTPLMKEAVEGDGVFDIKSSLFKNNVLFGGTKILQSIPDDQKTPDGGCLGFVLRTGFGTTQGKLVRTMIFSTDRVSANNLESLFFILFLMVFAIAASYHVWQQGIADGRKKSKLILDCILIITSVVPPELPMELSLAVNQSLMALSKRAIFCLEPFRIPFAGRVDVCCFDKTGTLTEENLRLEGVAGVVQGKKLVQSLETPLITRLVLGSCHSLMLVDNKIIGDPLEQAVINSLKWQVGNDDVVHAKVDGKEVGLKLVKRFAFSSALKRMTTLSQVSSFKDTSSHSFIEQISPKEGQLLVAVKGAPEVLRDMFTKLPDHYDEVYSHFAINGSRVLAVGYKWINGAKGEQASFYKQLKREEVESQLVFAGFLVFASPLKKDSKKAIKELRESSHRVVMITGDNPLTACHIAQELKIVTKPQLILDVHNDRLQWKSIHGDVTMDVYDSNGQLLSQDKVLVGYHLCATGAALQLIAHLPLYTDLLMHKIWVYARTSPSQKELILQSLKHYGYTTLMCGDGTNDVGALKEADVGVALLDGTIEDLEKIAKTMRLRRMQEAQKKQEELFKSWGQNLPDNVKQKQQEQVSGLMATIDDPNDVPVLKFGDASVAAPFTSKLSSIMSICEILRQGRCTLVTTIQMYKILALNCLITAFTLSALYMDGIKYGDTQMTLQGFLLAGCFMFLSWGKPIERLSKQRPLPNIFNFYIIGTVLLQFAVHAGSLWFVVTETKKLLPEDWKPDAEDKTFEPNLLNTSVYLISLSMQVSTFLINYQGRPFREALSENKPLYYSLLSLLGIAMLGAAQVSMPLNEWVQLVPMTSKFSEKLLITLILDIGLCYCIETVCSYLFSNNRPKASLDLEEE